MRGKEEGERLAIWLEEVRNIRVDLPAVSDYGRI